MREKTAPEDLPSVFIHAAKENGWSFFISIVFSLEINCVLPLRSSALVPLRSAFCHFPFSLLAMAPETLLVNLFPVVSSSGYHWVNPVGSAFLIFTATFCEA